MKKIVVITSSMRKNGNSNALAKAFVDGAKENNNDVRVINLYDKKIDYCKGCLACQKTEKCVIKDDANDICLEVGNADVVVFASPVYYYCISGQLKTMLDRLNPLYPSDYKFREVYFLATAADDEPNAVDGANKAIQGWVDCFDKATFVKTIFAGGVNDIGDIKDSKELRNAFELGKQI